MAGHFGGNPYNKWGRDTNAPHIARYFLARGFVMPGETVLDAACCTGYGSNMLAQVAEKVYGYEVDEGCIRDAKNFWGRDNIDFEVKDLNTCELPDVDVSVTIETVEHVDEMDHFVDQLAKHTRRLIIITVPLGGTSWAYKDEKPGPATEKNDFMNDASVDKLFFDRGWDKLTSFEFGYSHFGVYYKKDLTDYDWKKS